MNYDFLAGKYVAAEVFTAQNVADKIAAADVPDDDRQRAAWAAGYVEALQSFVVAYPPLKAETPAFRQSFSDNLRAMVVRAARAANKGGSRNGV